MCASMLCWFGVRTMEYVVHLGDMPEVMVCMEVGLTLVQSPPGVLKLLWIFRKEKRPKRRRRCPRLTLSQLRKEQERDGV